MNSDLKQCHMFVSLHVWTSMVDYEFSVVEGGCKVGIEFEAMQCGSCLHVTLADHLMYF